MKNWLWFAIAGGLGYWFFLRPTVAVAATPTVQYSKPIGPGLTAFPLQEEAMGVEDVSNVYDLAAFPMGTFERQR